MPDEEKEGGGRKVYSRLGGEGEERPRAKAGADAAKGAGTPPGAPWRVLVPLVVGFAILVGLVFGLGVLSRRTIWDTRFETQEDERKLSLRLETLRNLRLALSQLDTEARLRARVESGTRGVLLPPTDLRMRNERGAVETLLEEYDKLALKNAGRKQDVRRRAVEYVELTKNLEAYSLRGFASYRDLDEQLRALVSEVEQERYELEARRHEVFERARGDIRKLMWLAALTGLLVAAAALFEVWRRFRQMRRGYEALRRERQFSSQMLEGMPSAVAAVDRNDRIRSANAAFFEVFPGARRGASVHDDLAPPEGMRILASATATRVERATYRGRFALPVAGDSDDARAFDVYSSPLEIEGEPGQLLTLVDVTEAAEAEQELRRGEALAAVGKAAAQVAHEIKNPLGSIRLGVAMLRDMTKDRDAISTIDLVERGIDHLSKLTLDVTQFSRRRQLALADVMLSDILDDSLDLVADKVREKRTPVERRYSEEPVRGRWDEDQLRQVFVNLLGNAVDASPAESPVTVTVTRAQLAAGARGHNGGAGKTVEGARVSIADRGPGMDEKTAARIFEPFFTTKKKGTGLGLAIARQIVEQHGGHIRVESRPGEGTRFLIDLPLAAEGA